MSNEKLEPWQLSMQRLDERRNRCERAKIIILGEGTETEGIVNALLDAYERLEGLDDEANIEFVLALAESHVESHMEWAETEALAGDDDYIEQIVAANDILKARGLPLWEVEGLVIPVGKCKAHPRYKAVHKPRVACEPCWAYYFEVNEKKAVDTAT